MCGLQIWIARPANTALNRQPKKVLLASIMFAELTGVMPKFRYTDELGSTFMPDPISVPSNELFTSWKEIACYLNKGVRTAQRWEAEFGLPVQRPREKSRGVVQARRSDLDAWMNSQWARRAMRSECENREESKRHLELRQRNKQLMKDVATSILKLTSECDSLRTQFALSRELRGTERRSVSATKTALTQNR